MVPPFLLLALWCAPSLAQVGQEAAPDEVAPDEEALQEAPAARSDPADHQAAPPRAPRPAVPKKKTKPATKLQRALKAPEAETLPLRGEDVGWREKFYPFTMDDDLEPVLEENWVWFFLSGFLFEVGGSVWGPLLAMSIFGETDIPDGFLGDALWILVVRMVPHVALAALFLPVMFTLPIVPLYVVLFVIVWGINAVVNVPTGLYDIFYGIPVALVNAYDRRLKDQNDRERAEARLVGTPPQKKTPKKKRRPPPTRSKVEAVPKNKPKPEKRVVTAKSRGGVWPDTVGSVEVAVKDRMGCVDAAQLDRDLEAMLPQDASRRHFRLDIVVQKRPGKRRHINANFYEGLGNDAVFSRQFEVQKSECAEVPRMIGRMVRAHL